MRQTEQRARELKGLDVDVADAPPAEDEVIEDVEVDETPVTPWVHEAKTQSAVETLSAKYNAKVQWRDKQGKGRLEIYYDDYEALQTLLLQLGYQE